MIWHPITGLLCALGALSLRWLVIAVLFYTMTTLRLAARTQLPMPTPQDHIK
jgi:hypothetical protein